VKVYAYLIVLIIATISGGGIFGFILGVAFIIFWEVTGSMGKPRKKSQYSDEQYHQESYGEAPKATIQKLEPCIDILCFYALKHEKHWTTEKVKFVKNSFIHLCDTTADQDYLRERIKSKNRAPLATNVNSWLKMEPSTDDLEIIYTKICLLIVNTCFDSNQVQRDCLSFGTSLSLNYEYCEKEVLRLLKEREEYFNQEKDNYQDNQYSYQDTHTPELENAASILGIPSNSTRDQIQKAYRIKIKDFHPDRNVNVTDAVKLMLEEQAYLINNARDVMLKYLT
jgi:hypothetical protein